MTVLRAAFTDSLGHNELNVKYSNANDSAGVIEYTSPVMRKLDIARPQLLIAVISTKSSHRRSFRNVVDWLHGLNINYLA